MLDGAIILSKIKMSQTGENVDTLFVFMEIDIFTIIMRFSSQDTTAPSQGTAFLAFSFHWVACIGNLEVSSNVGGPTL